MKNRNVTHSPLDSIKSAFILLAITSLLLVQAACTKNREATFPEGAGQDLLAIADYDMRSEALETKESNGNVFYTSSEFNVEKESSKIKIVKYQHFMYL